MTTNAKSTTKTTETICRARYHADGDNIEIDWLNADAPGCKVHGNQFVAYDELPRSLMALFGRCFETARVRGIGSWMELTAAEMVVFGVKRL